MTSLLDEEIKKSLGDIPPTLAELFNRDPLSLTKSDLMSVVTHLRAQRLLFLTEEATSKNEKKRPNYKKATKIDVNDVEI